MTIDLIRQNEIFESKTPQEILKWGWESFGPDIALLSSFGTESVVLLHMVSQIAPGTAPPGCDRQPGQAVPRRQRGMKILFLETGYHFQETQDYKKLLVDKFKLNVIELTAAMSREEFVRTHGDDLYDKDPDKCCAINKVEPLQRGLKQFKAWVSGIRRGQGPTRKNVHILEFYEDGLYKLNPLANWTSKDAWQYIKANDLPTHPLFDKGYTSIGCWPCTRPVLPGEDDRAGRWAGRVKTECGIHTFMKPKENNP